MRLKTWREKHRILHLITLIALLFNLVAPLVSYDVSARQESTPEATTEPSTEVATEIVTPEPTMVPTQVPTEVPTVAVPTVPAVVPVDPPFTPGITVCVDEYTLLNAGLKDHPTNNQYITYSFADPDPTTAGDLVLLAKVVNGAEWDPSGYVAHWLPLGYHQYLNPNNELTYRIYSADGNNATLYDTCLIATQNAEATRAAQEAANATETPADIDESTPVVEDTVITMQLHVTDERSLAGADWALYGPIASMQLAGPVATGVVGDDNTIEIVNVPDGHYTLVISPDGQPALSVDLEIGADATPIVEIDPVAACVAALTGEQVDVDGDGIADACDPEDNREKSLETTLRALDENGDEVTEAIPGNTIIFEITLTNTGEVDLNNLVIDASLTLENLTCLDKDGATAELTSILAAGDALLCTGTYVVPDPSEYLSEPADETEPVVGPQLMSMRAATLEGDAEDDEDTENQGGIEFIVNARGFSVPEEGALFGAMEIFALQAGIALPPGVNEVTNNAYTVEFAGSNSTPLSSAATSETQWADRVVWVSPGVYHRTNTSDALACTAINNNANMLVDPATGPLVEWENRGGQWVYPGGTWAGVLGKRDATNNNWPGFGAPALGWGGIIIVEFTDNRLMANGNSSADIHIWERGSTPEKADIYVSNSTSGGWIWVGQVGQNNSNVDEQSFDIDHSPSINTGDTFRYVMLVDLKSAISPEGNNYDPCNTNGARRNVAGADIDSIQALSTVAVPGNLTIAQQVCTNGVESVPTLTIPASSGVTYTVVVLQGQQTANPSPGVYQYAPGSKVKVNAVPTSSTAYFPDDVGDDWTREGDRLATREITFSSNPCIGTTMPTINLNQAQCTGNVPGNSSVTVTLNGEGITLVSVTSPKPGGIDQNYDVTLKLTKGYKWPAEITSNAGPGATQWTITNNPDGTSTAVKTFTVLAKTCTTTAVLPPLPTVNNATCSATTGLLSDGSVNVLRGTPAASGVKVVLVGTTNGHTADNGFGSYTVPSATTSVRVVIELLDSSTVWPTSMGVWIKGTGTGVGGNGVAVNRAFVDLTFTPPPCTTTLSIKKDPVTTPIMAGDSAVFTITVKNEGTIAATGVKVTDVLPTNADYTWAATGDGWVCAAPSGGIITCALTGSLASGATSSAITVTGTYGGPAPTPDSCQSAAIKNAAKTSANNAVETSLVYAEIKVQCPSMLPSIGTQTMACVNGTDTSTFTITSNFGFSAPIVKVGSTTVNPTIPGGAIYAVNGGSTVTVSVTLHGGNQAPTTPLPDGWSNVGNVYTYTFTASSAPCLGLAKNANAATYSPGGTITYTITVTNSGSGAASGKTVQDTLPLNVTYVLGSTTINGARVGDPSSSGTNPQVLTWSGISVPAKSGQTNGTTKISYQVLIPNDGSVCGKITNLATLDTLTDSKEVTVNCSSGLEVTKKVRIGTTGDWKDTVEVTGPATVQYQVTVKNTGNTALSQVPFKDTLTNANSVLGVPTVVPANAITWNAGSTTEGNINSLAVDGTVVVTYTLTVVQADVDAGLTIENCASAIKSDTVKGEDCATITVKQDPKIDITKTDGLATDDTRVAPGTPFTYTLQVKNTGNVTLSNGTISDPLPQGIEFVSFVSNPGDGCQYVAATRTISCTGINLPVGNNVVEVKFTVKFSTVLPSSVCTNGVTNTATATGKPASSAAVQDSDNEVTKPDCKPSVSVNKQGPAAVDIGGTITYTITAKNTGNIQLPNLSMTDTLPTSLTNVTITKVNGNPPPPDSPVICSVGTSGTPSVTTVTCNFPNVAPDAERTVELTATAPTVATTEACAALIVNPVTAQGYNYIQYGSDDMAVAGEPASHSVSTKLNCPAIELDKEQVPGTYDLYGIGEVDVKEPGEAVADGDYIAYRISIKNTGNQPFTSVYVKDVPDAQIGFVATAPDDDMRCEEVTGGIKCYTWEGVGGVGQFEPQETRSIDLVFRVYAGTQAKICSIENTLTFLEARGPAGVIELTVTPVDASELTTVDCQPVLGLKKTVDVTAEAGQNPRVDPGDEFTWTITAWNSGAVDATRDIVDTLPADFIVTAISPDCGYLDADSDGLPDVNGEITCANVVLTHGTDEADPAFTLEIIGYFDAEDEAICEVPVKTNASSLVKVTDDSRVTELTRTSDVELNCPDIEITKIRITKTTGNSDSWPEDTLNAPANVSDFMYYRITVRNTGNVGLTGLEYRDILPAGTTTAYLGFSPKTLQDCKEDTTNPAIIVCSQLPGTTIEPNRTLTLVVGVQVDKVSPPAEPVCSVTNAAMIVSVNGIEVPQNPTGAPFAASVTTDVNCPKIAITKTQYPGNDEGKVTIGDTTYSVVQYGSSANPGDYVAYEIAIKNTGNVAIGAAEFKDLIPVGTTYVGTVWNSSELFCGFYNDPAQIQCSFMVGNPKPLALAPNGTRSVILLVKVNAFTPAANCSISNSATLVEATQLDKNSPFVSEELKNQQTTDPVKTNVNCLGMKLTKSDGGASVKPGDTFTYSIKVENTGNIALTEVTIKDTLPAGLSFVSSVDGCTAAGNVVTCPVGTLASPNSTTVTFVVQVDAAPSAAVCALTAFKNVATGTSGQTGNLVTSSNEEETPFNCDPGLLVTKKSEADLGDDSRWDMGDTISYTVTVKNTGNLDLVDVEVADQFDGAAGTLDWGEAVSSLAPDGFNQAPVFDPTTDKITLLKVGETVTITATYTITQADLDVVGGTTVLNCAGAMNELASDPIPDEHGGDQCTSDPITQMPDVAITKDAETNSVTPDGENAMTMMFAIVVENTGNVTLASGTITDPGSVPALPAGYTWTASVISGSDYLDPTTQTAFPFTVKDLPPHESIIIEMSVELPVVIELPESNAPQWCQTFENTATITGEFANDAIVVTVDGQTTTPGKSSTDDITVNCTGISIVKDGPASVTPGEEFDYTITVKNVGNTTQYSLVVTDEFSDLLTIGEPAVNAGEIANCDVLPADDTDPATLRCTISVMAPDDVIVITVPVTVTSTPSVAVCDDPEALVNQASVSQILPNFRTSSVVAGSGFPVDSNEVITDIDCAPKLEYSKIAVDTVVTPVDEPISFQLTVTNTGTYPSEPTTITDTLPAGLAGLTWTWTPADACERIGDSILCDVPALPAYTENAVTFTITAQTTATAPVCGTYTNQMGPTTGSRDQVVKAEVTIECVPNYEIEKTSDVGENTDLAVDDVVTYTVRVTNTGNEELAGIILTEDYLGEGTISWSTPADFDGTVPPIPVGGFFEATAKVAITQWDIDHGFVENCVDGTMALDEEDALERSDCWSDDIDQHPDLDATKTAVIDKTKVAPNDRVDAGDTITYTVSVKNTGNVTLTNVHLTDPLVGLDETIATLVPDASESFEVVYTIKLADLNAGSVKNCYAATGDGPQVDVPGIDTFAIEPVDPAASDEDCLITDLPQERDVDLEKTGSLNLGADAIANPGDVISYQFTVTNTGNTTLHGLTITDPLPGLTWTSGNTIASLDPGKSVTLTATYAITQADIDAGNVVNHALVKDTPPPGKPPVEDPGDKDVPVPQTPDIDLEKTGSLNLGADAIANPGDVISYQFTVTNTGNVTLTDVTITDPLSGLTWTAGNTVASMEPGQVVTLTATYAITQADIDEGAVLNHALVTGTPPNPADPKPEDPGDAEVPVPQDPAVDLEKTSTAATGSDKVLNEGEVITYTFTVTNTGNTTITDLTLTDPLPGLVWGTGGTTIASLAPGESVALTATYTVTVADATTGEVKNCADVTGMAPGDTEVTDQSCVTNPVTPNPTPTPPTVGELPKTGSGGGLGAASVIWAAAAFMIMTLGVGAIGTRRQTRR